MRRRLNLPFLAGLLVALAVLGSAVHVLHAFQVRRSARGLRDRAARARDEGHLGRAADYLQRYLGYEADDNDALADYGFLLERLAADPFRRREWPDARDRAFYAFEQVLRRDASRADVRRRLVGVAMDLSRFTDAVSHLDVLLRASPDDGSLHHLMGACQEELGNYRSAADAYARAVRHAPAQLGSYLRLADLQRGRLDQADQADRTMDALVAANPKTSQAHLARAVYRKVLALRDPAGKARLLEQAAADVAEARRLDPANAEAVLADADLAHATGRYEEAVRHARRAVALAPKDVRTHLMLAEARSRAGRDDEAVAGLREAVAAFRDRPEGLWRLTGMLLDLGALDDARPALDVLRKENNPTVDFLNAKLLVREEKWLGAARALERVRPLLAPVPDLTKQIHLLLGDCHARLGNPDQALVSYRQALILDPTGPAARLGIASSLLAAGRTDEAFEEYRKLAPLSSPARLAAARLSLLLALRRPDAERKWDETTRLLDEEEKKEPGSAGAAVLRAELSAARGDVAGARRLLEEACAARPTLADPWIALSQILESQGDLAGARKVLDEAERKGVGAVELRLARAGLWGRRGGPEAARALAGLADGVEALPSRRDQARLLLALGEAHYWADDRAAARRLWERLAQGPGQDDLGVRQRLFDLALRAEDADAVGRLAADLRRLEGEEGVTWRYAEAAHIYLRTLKGDGGRLIEARARLSEAGARRPGWPRVPLLEARLDELAGNGDKALEGYLRAVDLGDRQPDVFRRAMQLLYERRRYAEADLLLRKLPDQLVAAGGLDRVAAEVLLGRDGGRALELARRAVPESSKDYRDHLWLGQICLAAGQAAAAEKPFRRALELAGDAADPWVVLVQYLVRVGRRDEAEETIRRAEQALPTARAALPIAQCYEALGRPELAEKRYEGALATKPASAAALRGAATFYLRTRQPRKAEPVLRLMADPALALPEADAAWARRGLASTLVALGDFSRFAEALGLVEENVRRHGDSADDRRTRALVLAMYPARRREAIKVLEELAGKQALPPEHQLFLARLYELERDWPKARDQLLGLLAAAPDEPAYLAPYAEGLLRRGDLDETEGWVSRLAKKEPTAFRTVSLRARLRKAQGRAAEAAALLRDHAGARPDDLVSAAVLLEELGEDASAEELYRHGAASTGRPAFLLAAAVCLARQGRAGDALDLCEKVAAKCEPEDTAGAALAVAFAGPLDDAQFRRVEGWIEAARRKRPEALPVLFSLANLRFVQGRHAEAADLYRRLAQGAPNDAAVLNNLAWLLALGDGKPDEALAVVNQAIDRAGPLPDLLDTRGVIHLAAGRGAEAITDLEQALLGGPTPARYFHLAQARQAARNRAGAREALQSARRLGLRPAGLHPLERKAYLRVLAELEAAG